ncbi:hypothetical protein AgCh_029269 [Apium graveolens]
MSKIEAGKSEQSDDVETSGAKSREERLLMFMDRYSEKFKRDYDEEAAADGVCRDGRRSMAFRDYASHELDVFETDGFDMHDYSEFNDPGLLVQLYDPPQKPTDESCVAELQDCSLTAIQQYNHEHANSEALAPCRYYITFEATDEKNNNKQTFQARVSIFFPEWQKEVELVRIKTPHQPYCYPQATQSSTQVTLASHICSVSSSF